MEKKGNLGKNGKKGGEEPYVLGRSDEQECNETRKNKTGSGKFVQSPRDDKTRELTGEEEGKKSASA